MKRYHVPVSQIKFKDVKKCLKEHRPVIVTVSNKGKGGPYIWATGHPGKHDILLVSYLPDGKLLVCDSARDRAWAGNMQRFKIVTWESLNPFILTSRKALAASRPAW